MLSEGLSIYIHLNAPYNKNSISLIIKNLKGLGAFLYGSFDLDLISDEQAINKLVTCDPLASEDPCSIYFKIEDTCIFICFSIRNNILYLVFGTYGDCWVKQGVLETRIRPDILRYIRLLIKICNQLEILSIEASQYEEPEFNDTILKKNFNLSANIDATYDEPRDCKILGYENNIVEILRNIRDVGFSYNLEVDGKILPANIDNITSIVKNYDHFFISLTRNDEALKLLVEENYGAIDLSIKDLSNTVNLKYLAENLFYFCDSFQLLNIKSRL